jgi:hypothetical protein
MKKLLLGSLFAPMAFGPHIALADGWPVSVVGTWASLADEFVGKIQITSQLPTGDCRSITGSYTDPTSSGPNTIQGFYCPFSGRIHFLRYVHGTTKTFQAWSGNLSRVGVNPNQISMGGTFASDLNSFGEYGWLATMKPNGRPGNERDR